MTRAGAPGGTIPGAVATLALAAAMPLAAAATAPSQDADVALERGIELYWSGRYQETVEALSSVCGGESRARPDERIECLKYVAFSHVALGDAPSATDAFARLLEADSRYVLDPSTVSPKILQQFESSKARLVERLFARGKERYFEDRYAEASSIFEDALSIDPEHQLAQEYRRLSDERAALAAPPSPPEPQPQRPTPTLQPASAADPGPGSPPPLAPAEEDGDADDDRVYHLTSQMTPPVLVEKHDPVYPAAAMRARREGTVVITAVVDRDGSVRDARVIRSVGPDIDRVARSAVLSWRYRPALRDGRAVAVYSVIHLTFELE